MILDIQSEEVKRKLGYYKKCDKLCIFLREKRRERGYTLRRFSTQIGMTSTEYSKLERGELSPNAEEIMSISDFLGVDLLKLICAFAARELGEPIEI